MSMVTPHDLIMMQDDVREIIGFWNTTMTIFTPKPIDEQPNWNSMMREYNGDIVYDMITVPAERKDQIGSASSIITPNSGGDKIDANLLYTIPDVVNGKQVNISTNAFVQIDNTSDRYHIKSIKNRIGECLILLEKYVGGTPSGR